MLRLVAPWGFYGMGNTGDEGTVCGFARLLALGGVAAEVAMGSGNPRHSARVEPAFRYFAVAGRDPRRWWAKYRGNAQAIVGGTPIMDILGDWPLRDIAPLVRAAARRRLPFVCVGCGTEDLRLDASLTVFREHIAPHVGRWTVRSPRDQERLVRYGIPAEIITVAADVAWLIEPASREWGVARLQQVGLDPRRPLIGVNIANENSCFERHPDMAAALALALDRLIDERDAHVLFMCAEVREDPTFDLAAAKLIHARMTRADRASILPNDYLAPRELMSVIACCDLTVSMRYHFCLFSALQQVPFIAIRRADKVSDLCWDLEWRANVVPPAIDPDALVAHADAIRDDAPAHVRLLVEGRQKMMARAMKNLDALRGLPGMSDLKRR